MIDKIFNPKTNLVFYAICPNSKIYVGKLEDLQLSVICKNCNVCFEVSTPSCLNLFVTINPYDVIENLLNEHFDYYEDVLKKRKHEKGHIKDIYEGKLYRKFVQELPHNDRNGYVTAIFNTDGAPMFKTSQYSIWPVYLLINELSPQVRLNNLITCDMWFGKDKPEMISFLNPFVIDMNRFSEEGHQFTIKGESRIIKLYPLVACVDSIAREPMQGLKQFNGRYWYLHPGKFISGNMKYPVLESIPQERDMANFLRYFNEAVNENVDDVFGIKYGSSLISMSHFNIVDGFVPDYMHCCLSGVGKQITEMFLSSLKVEQIDLLDSNLMNIKAHHQLARLTRPLSDRKSWKSREYENYILY